jgi:flagellar hook-length control protein FliK
MTIAPLAAAVPTAAVPTAAGGAAPTGQPVSGDVFAGLMGAPALVADAATQGPLGTASHGGTLAGGQSGDDDAATGGATDPLADGHQGEPQAVAGEPTPAQIMAAAQVLPVAQLLANAPAIDVPVDAEAPSGETAVSGTQAPAAATASTLEGAATGSGADSRDGSGSGPSDEAAGAAVQAAQLSSATDGAHRAEPGPATEPVTGPAAGTAATTEATTGATHGQLPVGPTAPTQGAGRPEPTAATAASGVTGQVFPEVTRLVSRGDGTQRITMKLNPEALGDVRVVLTVRNGEVHVRMAGSELAQHALLQGAPELHRLLDLAGATSSQIVVGEQTATSTAGHQGSSHHGRHDTAHDLLGSQDGMQHGAGQGHQNHRTAGTRDGDTSARDGAHRGEQPHLSADPAATSGGSTRTRTAGVDVSM